MMSVPLKYIVHQGPVLRGMGEAIVGALKQRAGISAPSTGVPGPVHQLTVAPRSRDLVNA